MDNYQKLMKEVNRKKNFSPLIEGVLKKFIQIISVWCNFYIKTVTWLTKRNSSRYNQFFKEKSLVENIVLSFYFDFKNSGCNLEYF